MSDRKFGRGETNTHIEGGRGTHLWHNKRTLIPVSFSSVSSCVFNRFFCPLVKNRSRSMTLVASLGRSSCEGGREGGRAGGMCEIEQVNKSRRDSNTLKLKKNIQMHTNTRIHIWRYFLHSLLSSFSLFVGTYWSIDTLRSSPAG